MYNGIPGELDQPSFTNEIAICDFQDHPYSSPSEDSENDNEIRELDFSEFSMDNRSRTGLIGQIAADQNQPISVSDKNAERLVVSQREAIVNSSTDWCSCGQCSPCPPREAVCCHDKPEVQDFMESAGGCITEQTFFQAQLMSEEGLQYNRMLFASIINDHEARQKYLEQVFDNGKRRHLCYRNFLIFVNRGQPIGRGNRVVLPQCVVAKIRERYPDPSGNYVGFSNSMDNM